MADPLRRRDAGDYVALDRAWFAQQTREAVDTFLLPVTTVVDTIRARVYGDPGKPVRNTAAARGEVLRRARKLARQRALAAARKKHP